MTEKVLGNKALLNRKSGEGNGGVIYTPVTLYNVRVEERQAQRQEKRGQSSLETFKLFFDMTRSYAESEAGERLGYIPEFVWDRLGEDARKNYFTFGLGDRVFPVLSKEDADALGIPETLRRLSSYTVNSVVPCYTSKGLHHLEVSGRGRIFEN